MASRCGSSRRVNRFRRYVADRDAPVMPAADRRVIPRWKGSRESEHRVFEELLSEHLDALYRTALRLCRGHIADAEDLLQDTSIRAFDGFDSLRDRQALRGWLFSILVRTNLNRIRSSGRRAEEVASDMDDAAFEDALAAWMPSRSPEDDADRAQIGSIVTRAVDALSEELRPVIVLIDAQGFRQREVAEMLGIPEGTVASRLFRARSALRSALVSLHPSATGRANP